MQQTNIRLFILFVILITNLRHQAMAQDMRKDNRLASSDTVKFGRVNHELVLPVGASITAKNVNGEIEITATGPQERMVKWKNRKRTFPIDLWETRDPLGHLGGYQPANRWIWDLRKRTVYREYEIHGASINECLKQLVSGSAVYYWVWNQDGYVVGFCETPERNQLGVTVMRMVVSGKTRSDFPPNGTVIVKQREIGKIGGK